MATLSARSRTLDNPIARRAPPTTNERNGSLDDIRTSKTRNDQPPALTASHHVHASTTAPTAVATVCQLRATLPRAFRESRIAREAYHSRDAPACTGDVRARLR